MKNEEIKKELKSLQNRLDELIEGIITNGGNDEEARILVEAATKIRGARIRIKD